MSRLFLLFSLCLIAACQSNSSRYDFDPQRNFSNYQSWQWKEQDVLFLPDDPRVRNDLTAQRVVHALNEQLRLRGLHPASQEQPADMLIQASISIDTRQEVLRSQNFEQWGHPFFGPVFSDVRTIEYPVRTLQIDFFDRQDGRLIWRGTLEVPPDDGRTPEQRSAAVMRDVAKILQNYPPQ